MLCKPNLILLLALREGCAKNMRLRTNLMADGNLGSPAFLEAEVSTTGIIPGRG